jgi:hypothetical protein
MNKEKRKGAPREVEVNRIKNITSIIIMRNLYTPHLIKRKVVKKQ